MRLTISARRLDRRLPAAALIAAAAITLVLRSTGLVAAEAPYRLVPNWAHLPAGTAWGVMSWVTTDADGRVYAFQRSDPASKIMVFDANGAFLRSWGDGEFSYPHSLRFLRDGWTEGRGR